VNGKFLLLFYFRISGNNCDRTRDLMDMRLLR